MPTVSVLAAGALLAGHLLLAAASAAAQGRSSLAAESREPAGAAQVIAAVKAGDIERARTLLEAGAEAGAPEPDGSSALLWASHRDDLAMARLLIGGGADVNAANDLGATPLWAAGQNGSTAMIEALLAAGADPNQALLSGETPVMVAARTGSAAAVEQLSAAGADPDRRGTRGQTALMWAAAQRHAGVIDVLLRAGADPHVRSEVWTQVMAVPPHSRPEYNRSIPHGGNTALLFAIRAGHLPSARLLVAAGADVNDTDAWGVSAAVLAVHGGHRELLEFLLAAGADPSAAGAGFAPLHEAVMRNDARMTAALLAHGADPNQRLETWTPTRRASRDLHYPPAFVGATPFWLAARFARTEVMRLLADWGADPKFVLAVSYIVDGRLERTTERTTTLMAALGAGGRRARPWVPHSDRRSVEERVLEAVKLVVDLGVDVNAVDAAGRTGLDLARALQYASVTELLLEAGAVAGRRIGPGERPAISPGPGSAGLDGRGFHQVVPVAPGPHENGRQILGQQIAAVHQRQPRLGHAAKI